MRALTELVGEARTEAHMVALVRDLEARILGFPTGEQDHWAAVRGGVLALHMEAGGNSGTFLWSSAVPGKNRLPDGMEVQMLDPGWVDLNIKDGVKPPVAYVHGELFPVGGVTAVPDNPRGPRSSS